VEGRGVPGAEDGWPVVARGSDDVPAACRASDGAAPSEALDVSVANDDVSMPSGGVVARRRREAPWSDARNAFGSGIGRDRRGGFAVGAAGDGLTGVMRSLLGTRSGRRAGRCSPGTVSGSGRGAPGSELGRRTPVASDSSEPTSLGHRASTSTTRGRFALPLLGRFAASMLGSETRPTTDALRLRRRGGGAVASSVGGAGGGFVAVSFFGGFGVGTFFAIRVTARPRTSGSLPRTE